MEPHSTQHDTTPATAEDRSRAALAPYWGYLGADEPDYPLSTSDVLDFTARLDYDCDGDFLLGLADAGTIPVERVGGRLAWSACCVHLLLAQLEGRRRWRLSPLHQHKFTALERAEIEARAAGEPTSFADLGKHDLESLLIFLTDADHWETRHAVWLAIRAKLRLGDIL